MRYKSSLLTSASGSIGGLNASHNRGSAYMRAKPRPSFGISNDRERAKSVLGSLSSMWQELSDADRQDWHTYAINVNMPKRPGSVHQLDAYHHFVRSLSPRLRASQSLPYLTSAPSKFDLGDPPIIDYLSPALGPDGRLYLYLELSATVEDYCSYPFNFAYTYCSPPVNTTRETYHKGFTLIDLDYKPSTVPPIPGRWLTTPWTLTTPIACKIWIEIHYNLYDNRLSYRTRAWCYLTFAAGAKSDGGRAPKLTPDLISSILTPTEKIKNILKL